MHKEPTNHLDSFDFCVRKTIAIHVFGNRDNETLSDLARACETTPQTMSKWISYETEDGKITTRVESRRAPSFSQILLASVHLSMPIADMLEEAVKGEKKAQLIPSGMLEKMQKLLKDLKSSVTPPKRYDNRTDAYLKKIRRVGNAQYIGFFLQGDKLQHMIIDAYEPYRTGSVPMTARIIGKAGNPYRGNIVSPPGNDHLYFYIRQEDGKNDRGLMVFYIDDDMQDKYRCGSGLLLSTDRRTGKIRLQWVVIIRKSDVVQPSKTDTMLILQEIQEHESEVNRDDFAFENNLSGLDKIIKPFLEGDMPSAENNSIHFDNLRERQEQLFELCKNLFDDEVVDAEKQVEITKMQYEAALARLEQVKTNV